MKIVDCIVNILPSFDERSHYDVNAILQATFDRGTNISYLVSMEDRPVCMN